jgi:glycosyltransferase involved in cell wall biosynthesis
VPATPEDRAAIRRELGLNTQVPAIAFVGELGDRRKGFDLLFDAWRMLGARGASDAKLLVVGQGAELEKWKARASSSELSDSIRFLGFRRDVPKILKACDALISPTRYEAYGLGVHEAICCGVPALVSASAGVAERYPAELSSLLIPEPLSAECVAERLRDWWENSQRFEQPLARFGQTLRQTSWEQMSSRIVELIDATCASKCSNVIDNQRVYA